MDQLLRYLSGFALKRLLVNHFTKHHILVQGPLELFLNPRWLDESYCHQYSLQFQYLIQIGKGHTER